MVPGYGGLGVVRVGREDHEYVRLWYGQARVGGTI